MYQSAVKDAAEPDYKKGFTFLTEFRRHRPVERLTPRNQCFILTEFATCYHGLGRVEDAARAAIDLVQVAKSWPLLTAPRGTLRRHTVGYIILSLYLRNHGLLST
ncbi:hypothetical protein FOMG_19452 [Fusarium oxysporum f. sp. melonis 26406]|uniref:Uncharacterized protein n=1 Tax=Fusarium oxysporum f. sp. melonis 26406 TaxID=1089452 RepID=W9Z694_FUSOX|nr:hypothetical protein FOMG_19452 [Fusarium oxysporum f. sp. melonis 26406]